MLLPLVIGLGLAVLGMLVVAKVTQIAIRRLRLDFTDVLVWFGLAEAPVDELAARRRGAHVRPAAPARV